MRHTEACEHEEQQLNYVAASIPMTLIRERALIHALENGKRDVLDTFGFAKSQLSLMIGHNILSV